MEEDTKKTKTAATEAEKPNTEAPAPKGTEPSETGADAVEKVPKKKKKAKRTVLQGNVHVLATFNNTIITITDQKGNSLANSSAGSNGFRGSKKGTAYAAQVAAEKAINEAKQNYGLATVNVFVKGIGLGRDAAIRTLMNQRLNVENIKDITGLPHGGVRPRRAKRN